MKITPLEIRQHAFEKIFRGYNIEEVDNFLANVSLEWERVLNESKMLRMQLEIAEKEANKLREIEMTLFKTLKTAEDTSTMITEQANQQAEKHVGEANQKGEQIIQDANTQADSIIKAAENRAKYIKEEVLGEVKGLERDFKVMDHYKDNLLVQMKSLANATIDHVERFESKFDKEGINARFSQATSIIEDEANHPIPQLETPHVQHDEVNHLVEPSVSHLDDVVHTIETLQVHEETPIAHVSEFVPTIETPIAHLNDVVHAIETPIVHEETPIVHLNDVVHAIETPIVHEEKPQVHEETPVAHLNDVNHAIETPIVHEETHHIPEQAIVHSEVPVQIDDLKIIEGIGIKIADILNKSGITSFKDLATTPAFKIKELLEKAGPQYASHNPSTWGEQAKLAAEGNMDELRLLQDKLYGGRLETAEIKTESSHVDTPSESYPKAESSEQITEEMLEKVNKVKAAIRKSMSEKNEAQQSRDYSPLTTVKDVMAKNEGSFFDNF